MLHARTAGTIAVVMLQCKFAGCAGAAAEHGQGHARAAGERRGRRRHLQGGGRDDARPPHHSPGPPLRSQNAAWITLQSLSPLPSDAVQFSPVQSTSGLFSVSASVSGSLSYTGDPIRPHICMHLVACVQTVVLQQQPVLHRDSNIQLWRAAGAVPCVQGAAGGRDAGGEGGPGGDPGRARPRLQGAAALCVHRRPARGALGCEVLCMYARAMTVDRGLYLVP